MDHITDNGRPPCTGTAFGGPGLEPRWTVSAKDAVGTAYSTASRVWFTLSLGVLSEIYYPAVDQPQTRDFQYLITDGASFFHEEKRDLDTTIEPLSPHALGFRVTSRDPAGRYRIVKEIIADPHLSVVLIDTRVEGDDAAFLSRLKLYALLAPHLECGGKGNSGRVVTVADRSVLAAVKGNTWLAMGCTAPFARTSCGFVGASDGWTDLHQDFQMDWIFDRADNGNIALTGEIDLSRGLAFTLGIGFGDAFHSAATALFQSLDSPFEMQRERFVEQWERTCAGSADLSDASGDNGRLFYTSQATLLAHEDKTYQGATIASLSIPWGQVKKDEDLGGYHLVWTRDLYHTVTALLAIGHFDTARRALVYLACAQNDEGGFPQNFWLDGTAYWKGIQLDGIAYPILIAWRLKEAGALQGFDPYPMVRGAASFLITKGPATQQERWEENSGLSPSTLASNIAALTCASAWARERGDDTTAGFIQDYADFLEQHVEAWTVTNQGTLLPGEPWHYVRITPADPEAPHPNERPEGATVTISNRPPGTQTDFPASDVVDAGFIELVRLGIRAPDTPLMQASLRVVDAVLKVDTPAGPCWHRYNHDGYGQRDDGGPYEGWGTGRAWPILTGERGHYELAGHRDASQYARAMEAFASRTCQMPEQVWDAPDRPEDHLFLGGPTGAAMPLAWAHAEYVKLLRSIRDGEVFDRIPLVAARYLSGKPRRPIEVWKFNRQVQSVPAGTLLRVQARAPFTIRWAATGEQDTELPSTPTTLDIHYADLEMPAHPISFTFYWPEAGRWEGQDFHVAAEPILL